jgi:hypothetical protein
MYEDYGAGKIQLSPRGLFGSAAGVIRWRDRVIRYAFTLVNAPYPPFRLRP